MSAPLVYFAEYLATFFFILAILISGGAPLMIGLALAIAVLLVGSISGGHLNPAVSITMWLNRRLTDMELVYYIVAQVLGGASAYYVFRSSA